mmetsp:Transcript_12968/g.21245  ORF Transcript_12968/g.21245 Transcript_12968/m.21245 type:complete len:827 (-) Transcript_12968:647-3127(-)
MFVLRGLSSLVWGSGGAEKIDLFQLSNGKLFEFVNGKQKCLFIDCTATIRRTDTKFRYELKIAREAPENDDEEERNEYSFILQPSLQFARAPIGSSLAGSKDLFECHAFTWITETSPYAFESESSSKSDRTIDTFHAVVCQCLWENAHQQALKDGDNSAIEEFSRLTTDPQPASVSINTPSKPRLSTSTPAKPNTPPTPSPAKAPTSSHSTTTTTTSVITPAKVSSPTKGSTPTKVMSSPSSTSTTDKKSTTPSQSASAPPQSSFAIGGEVLIRLRGEFFEYQPSSGEFVKVPSGEGSNCDVTITRVSDYDYRLFVSQMDKDSAFMEAEVSQDMNVRYSEEHHSVVWTALWSGSMAAFSVIFSDGRPALEKFQSLMTKCLYETTRREDFDDIGENDRAFMFSALREQVDNMEADDGYNERDQREFIDDEEEADAEARRRSLGMIDEDEELDDEEEADDRRGGSSSIRQRRTSRESLAPSQFLQNLNERGEKKNNHLALSYKSDRAFLTRGQQIGVFKDADEDMEHVATIKSVRGLDGRIFTPSKIMLHQGEKSMLMLSKDNTDRIYNMDLERCEVVEEWGLHKDVPNFNVKAIAPEFKFGQMENNQVFVGVNDKNVFQMDPRLWGKNKGILNESKKMSYTKNPFFSGVVTTEAGNVVVGSTTGELRFYNDISKRAKTSLPGLGDPIIGIDVTADGKWILATTNTYLLVVPSQVEGADFFKKSVASLKPVPRKLQLKAEDKVKYGISQVKFTQAHFDVNRGNAEESIVTSSGCFVITWNFRKVKQNKLDEYKIKKMEDVVVADQFPYMKDEKVVVVMPSDIKLAKRK